MPSASRSLTDDRLSVDWSTDVPPPSYRGRRRAVSPEAVRETEPVLRSEVLDAIANLTPAAAPAAAAPAPVQFRTRAEAKAAWAAQQQGARTPRVTASATVSTTASTTVLPGLASPNVRRAPQTRAHARVEQSQPRHRTAAVVGALGAVAALGVAAVLGGALPTQAAGDSANSLSPRSSSGSGGGFGGGTVTRSEQSSARPAGGTLDRAFRMVAVSRSEQRGPIAGCSGKAPTQSYSNGQLPLSILCSLPFASGHRLRADAAVQLIRLNDSYKGRFGHDICLTDSYRSLASQYSLAVRKPGLAARPGSSEHGWGLAIDMCDGPDQPGSVRRAWFLANAPKFGWDNPQWARPGTGSRPEPWHWEFVTGEAKTSTSQD